MVDVQEGTTVWSSGNAGGAARRTPHAMSQTLSDLIRSVRACKTAAEERATINEECALIRTALKEEKKTAYRERNMLKLLFVHMLGYSTHWGQMECIKLIASPHFHEKRAGYLVRSAAAR